MYTELNRKYKNKIIKKRDLLKKIGSFPRKKKVVMCHGVFDVVHPGHIRHLAFAKSKGDILVASLTSDKFVTKGRYRPHIPENLRAFSLSAFDMVDYVIIDDKQKPLDTIKYLKPDFFAKGFEYSDDLPKETKEEIQTLDSYGGGILFSPGDIVYSSSALLTEYLPKLNNEKLLHLLDQDKSDLDEIINHIQKFKNFKVHVIGDTIVDTYTRTQLIGGNTKTPTFSVLYGSHEDYVGGAGIVAKHLVSAGAQVTFTSVVGDDKLGKFVEEDMQNQNLDLNLIIDENRPTTNKNAIIADDYRLLKIDKLDNSPYNTKIYEKIKDKINSTNCDAIIFSDFRHGMFTKSSISTLSSKLPQNVLKVADSQVASRWGNITEFRGFDLITPNEREARFSLADQDSNIAKLAFDLREATDCSNVIMKLGKRGAFFVNGNTYNSVDSFATDIKDAVGAGDALLAYSTLMLLSSKSLIQSTILGSIAAALECEYDGNIPVISKVVTERIYKIKSSINS